MKHNMHKRKEPIMQHALHRHVLAISFSYVKEEEYQRATHNHNEAVEGERADSPILEEVQR
jgi:hypothetical protein